MKPEVVADNEIPGPEPEGFWEPVHREVRRLVKGTQAVLLAGSDIAVIPHDD